MARLLAEVADAADFARAASLLCERLAAASGAPRATLYVLSADQQALEPVAWSGFGGGDGPGASVRLTEERHPLVVCLLSLAAVVSDGRAPASAGPRFASWYMTPLPRPHFHGAARTISRARATALAPEGCRVHPRAGAGRRRRLGQAPCGVVVLEGTADEPGLRALARAACLAGPVLARTLAVDEFRRAAERVDRERALLTAIIDALPDPIVFTDAAERAVVHNRRARRLLTVPDGASEGHRRAVEINELLFATFLERAAETARGVDGGGDHAGERAGERGGEARSLTLVDPEDGGDLLFEVLVRPLADPTRERTRVWVLRDVTDLRRAAAELERQVRRGRRAELDARRERDRLNLILENVADPIIVTDDQSQIILMNRQAEQLLTPPELPGGTDAARRAAAGNDATFTQFVARFTGAPERARREQMRLARPDGGAPLPVEVASGKISNDRGEVVAIVSVLHDLTEQAENERLYEALKEAHAGLEARIAAATADLAAQNARLQWQAHELAKANRLKSDFLASMSHELRTPINALIGYTSLMLDRIFGELTPKQEEGLHRIHASAEHLLELINDILDLAKIEAGKMPLHLEEVPLGQVVSEIAQQMEPLVARRGLRLACELPPDGLPMFTDRTKVRQILLNLVSNAVKFTHAGSVRVSAAAEGDGEEWVRIEVADTGIGIRSEELEHIWEDFRQVDQSRTREYGGTGLGLSITRRLAAALGGSVSVVSRFGEGSTFTTRLPRQSRAER